MAKGDWDNITDDPLSSGDQSGKDEPRQRDSEKWRMPTDDDRQVHIRVTGAPEDMRVLPGDIKLKPDEIGNEGASSGRFEEQEIWTEDPLASTATFDAFYWDTHNLQTSILDP